MTTTQELIEHQALVKDLIEVLKQTAGAASEIAAELENTLSTFSDRRAQLTELGCADTDPTLELGESSVRSVLMVLQASARIQIMAAQLLSDPEPCPNTSAPD